MLAADLISIIKGGSANWHFVWSRLNNTPSLSWATSRLNPNSRSSLWGHLMTAVQDGTECLYGVFFSGGQVGEVGRVRRNSRKRRIQAPAPYRCNVEQRCGHPAREHGNCGAAGNVVGARGDAAQKTKASMGRWCGNVRREMTQCGESRAGCIGTPPLRRAQRKEERGRAATRNKSRDGVALRSPQAMG